VGVAGHPVHRARRLAAVLVVAASSVVVLTGCGSGGKAVDAQPAALKFERAPKTHAALVKSANAICLDAGRKVAEMTRTGLKQQAQTVTKLGTAMDTLADELDGVQAPHADRLAYRTLVIALKVEASDIAKLKAAAAQGPIPMSATDRIRDDAAAADRAARALGADHCVN
jgi:hypothetical protein